MRNRVNLKMRVGENLSIKFIAVSVMNFVVGYLLFSLTWLALQSYLSYLQIAILATSFAAVWSFQSHNRITLNRQSIKSFVSPQYLLFQITTLLLSSILVPMVSVVLAMNLLVIQFFWTILVSLLGLIVIIRYSK